jgi:Zn-dependent protease
VLPGLIAGLTVHEFAHAWVADKLGDGFPRACGRISLNPLRHLSFLGTLAILLLPFGWAKPVQVNLYNFRHPKRDFLLCSLAGPAANLALAAVCVLLMHPLLHPFGHGAMVEKLMTTSLTLLKLGVLINVILAVLNLLPIPPLDGSKIWPCVIPGMKPAGDKRFNRIGFYILIGLMASNAGDKLFQPMIKTAVSIMPVDDKTRWVRFYNAGYDQFEKKDYAAAAGFFTVAIQIRPDESSAFYFRGKAEQGTGDHAAALSDADRAISLISVYPKYHALRAECLDDLGRKQEAREAWKNVNELNKRSASQPAESGK